MNYSILLFLIIGIIIGLIRDITDKGEGVSHSDNIFTFMFRDKY